MILASDTEKSHLLIGNHILLKRSDSFATQHSRSSQHSLYGPGITSAATEIARECVTHLCFSRAVITFEQCGCRKEHARYTKTALGSSYLNKGLLQRVQIWRCSQTFSCCDSTAPRLCC